MRTRAETAMVRTTLVMSVASLQAVVVMVMVVGWVVVVVVVVVGTLGCLRVAAHPLATRHQCQWPTFPGRR